LHREVLADPNFGSYELDNALHLNM